jgi:HAD superfamily hydrolase (TIGR01509 family)
MMNIPVNTPTGSRGLIFDCDGVLVDSEVVANTVLAGLVTEMGLPTSTEESIARYMGLSWASIEARVASEIGADPPADFRQRYWEGVVAAWEAALSPVPGVVEALDRIDLPYCVASSGDHERIRLTLGLTGLLPRFEGRIFSATEVLRGKPAPDLFLHAARSMGFEPSQTTVVEDTLPGVEAGRAAGMRVLAYAALVDPQRLEEAGGVVFTDMRHLPDLL